MIASAKCSQQITSPATNALPATPIPPTIYPSIQKTPASTLCSEFQKNLLTFKYSSTRGVQSEETCSLAKKAAAEEEPVQANQARANTLIGHLDLSVT
jgi:hypothetical protein